MRTEPGLQYFSDGRRKVDYVLVYNQRRPASVRQACSAPPHRISVISNGNFPPPGAPGEVCLELGPDPPDPGDGDKVLIRQEFEAILLDAGLEIERDSEVRRPACVRACVFVFVRRTRLHVRPRL